MNLILKHLNDDTTWFIKLNEVGILIDPWLVGSQTDYFRFFSTQEHLNKSSIENFESIENEIDVIIISHHYTDHCHEQTLRLLSRSIPIFATKEAFKRVRSWNYFHHLYQIPQFSENSLENSRLDQITKSELNLLKYSQISVGYLPESGLFSYPSLHGVTIISFLFDQIRWKSIFYIPHGCQIDSILKWYNKQSNIDVSVLLQGFDRVWNPRWLGGLLNYGYEEGAQIVTNLNIPYWISTHDEDKIARGFVSLFLRRKHSNIEQAQNQLNKHFSSNNQQNPLPKLHHILNGDSLAIHLNN